MKSLRDKYCVVGVGETEYSRASGRTTRALAVEYAPFGIRVNAICPGYVDTPINVAYWNTFPDPLVERRRAEGLQPLKRLGTPDEIAWPAVFLASDEAGFITGASLMVDGGRSVLFHD